MAQREGGASKNGTLRVSRYVMESFVMCSDACIIIPHFTCISQEVEIEVRPCVLLTYLGQNRAVFGVMNQGRADRCVVVRENLGIRRAEIRSSTRKAHQCYCLAKRDLVLDRYGCCSTHPNVLIITRTFFEKL